MRRKTIPPLRKGATDAEVIRWTKKYDVFDRLNAQVSEVVEDHSDLDRILQEALFQDNTAQRKTILTAVKPSSADLPAGRQVDL